MYIDTPLKRSCWRQEAHLHIYGNALRLFREIEGCFRCRAALGVFLRAVFVDDATYTWLLHRTPILVPSAGTPKKRVSRGFGHSKPTVVPCPHLQAFARANGSTRSGVSRCRRCGAGNSGACNFVLDEGPYCWKGPGSNEVEPCSVCCTEPTVRTRCRLVLAATYSLHSKSWAHVWSTCYRRHEHMPTKFLRDLQRALFSNSYSPPALFPAKLVVVYRLPV